MEKTIALIPGDGIGPDVVAEAVNVLDAVAKKIRPQMELHKRFGWWLRYR